MNAYKFNLIKSSSYYHSPVWPVVPAPQSDAPLPVRENVADVDLRASLTTKIRRLPLPRGRPDHECC